MVSPGVRYLGMIAIQEALCGWDIADGILQGQQATDSVCPGGIPPETQI
jgi:hypothetical protein